MHILHLLKTSEGGTWALELIKALKEKYPELSFSVILPAGGKYYSEYQTVCKNVYDFEFNLDASLFKRGKELQKIVKKDCPDLIHSWFTQTTLYARLFLKKIDVPRLFQVVGPLHLENVLFRSFDIGSASKNDYWIATSKCIEKLYINAGVKQEKVFFNYAFIDTDKLYQQAINAQPISVKEQFGIPQNYKIIGTSSFIYPPKIWQKVGIKGHEYLLKAYQDLLLERQDVALIIGGATFGNNLNYEKRLKHLASKIKGGRVIFTGKYDKVYPLIANFDVFVYLSTSENLGGVFESLLFGVPTISSNAGGLPELVINGETGFNCAPNDTRTLIRRINFMLDNPKSTSEMRDRGRNRVLEVFNKERNIDRAFEIYQSVIK